MRTLACVLAGLALLLPALAAPAPAPGLETDGNPIACDDSVPIPGGFVVEGYTMTSRPPLYGFLPDEVVSIPSAVDGAAIQIGLIRPDVPQGTLVPVVAMATPYAQGLAKVNLRECAARLAYNLVPQGYAVAIVAVRGTADSGGCMDLMGPLEGADLDQAVTWLGTRSWSNGNVGMTGLSYEGSTPWEVAARGNPHLKTIVPVEGVSDFFDLLYHDGAPEARALAFTNAFYDEIGAATVQPAGARSLEHVVGDAACPEWADGLRASAESFRTGERDHLGFWAARDQRPGVLANYTGSVFLVQGLQDWNVDGHENFPWARELAARNLTVKLLLPQGPHVYPDELVAYGDDTARADWPDLLLAWLDRFLKEDASLDVGPAVQVQDSGHHWRNETMWPPADATETALALCADGSLATACGAARGRVLLGPDLLHPGGYADQYGLDQFLDGTPDACGACASFRGADLAQETRFAGTPEIDLTLAPTAASGHVAAFLYVEDALGAHRVGWGQADLRFAAGDGHARAFAPGAPLAMRLRLEPLDVVVPAGSHLRLLVSQGYSSDHVASSAPAPVWLETGGAQGALRLETFARGASDLFTP